MEPKGPDSVPWLGSVARRGKLVIEQYRPKGRGRAKESMIARCSCLMPNGMARGMGRARHYDHTKCELVGTCSTYHRQATHAMIQDDGLLVAQERC